MNDYIIIFMTAPKYDDAKKISKMLIEKHLIACANIVPKVFSIYRWEGDVCEDEEALVIMKTRRSHFPEIKKLIMESHSYDVPEIIAIDIVDGSEAYLNWIGDSVQ